MDVVIEPKVEEPIKQPISGDGIELRRRGPVVESKKTTWMHKCGPIISKPFFWAHGTCEKVAALFRRTCRYTPMSDEGRLLLVKFE